MVSELISYINRVKKYHKSNSTARKTIPNNKDPNSALIPLSCLNCKSVSNQSGGRDEKTTNGRMTHRVLDHIDITSISFLVLPYLLSLARAKTNTRSIYRRLTVDGTALRIISNQNTDIEYSHRINSALTVNA
jgi:hypothetical protein